tara:strand:- start:914 stop:1489 length:576 start_codon:yes stop_codon:yes gene_type:complete
MAKKCRACKTPFEPYTSLQVACSPACALTIGKREAEKKAEREAKAKRKWVREQKERLKSRSDHMREAQQAFNAYVRQRDEDQPCISCGRSDSEIGGHLTGGKWDCGHYRSVGANPELRFEPLNAHRQCKKCNRDLSGNVVDYRINLIRRIGQEAVDWIEGPHEAKKYTIDDLKEIKARYRALKRELERRAA